MNLAEFQQLSISGKKKNQAVLKKLGKMEPGKLDILVHGFHHEVFSVIDCLDCGNCCRTLGPRVTESDIDHLASSLKIKPSKFITEYLKKDEDNDFVFQSMPCPFLGSDNYCSVYEDRPKACREYPHTDRRRFSQLLPLTLKNSMVCPAVLMILERLNHE